MKGKIWHLAIFAVLTVCAGCSKKSEDTAAANTGGGEAQTQYAATADEVPSGSSDARVKDLGKLVDLIVAEAADLPRTEFDPAALAAQLGRNPQAHFEWVRDRTWWAPYRGMLRGSGGVMLDRVGSSLDRAALLGDLLRRSGHTVRLAHAQLSESRAAELLARVRSMPDRRRSLGGRDQLSAERQRSIEAIVPGHGKSLQEQIAVSGGRVGEAEALVRSQADQLHAAVKDAAPPGKTDDGKAIAALRDHWWVERLDDGKWIAMDTLLPDAVMGVALIEGSSRSEWKKGAAAPSIPASDWHTVQVRVVIERYENGATTEAPVLERILRPAELLERQITLGHMPKPWPDSLPDAKTDPNALGNAAVNVREWVPYLRIGREVISQSGFTENGEVIADPFNPQRDIAKVGGGGFMTGFGEALGGGESASSSVTAEWIDYEIRVPGEPAQRLRRPIFDLLGPVNRAAKAEGFDAATNDRLIERYEALLSSTDILLAPCAFSGEFVTHLATAGIVANQRAIKDLSRERDPAKARDLASTILDNMETWGPLPDMMLWRTRLGQQPGEWFVDRPNIFSYRMTRSAVNADRVAFRELIDIASNSIGVRRGAGRNPFEVRMHQGVADTVAEMLALGAELDGAENTASILAMAGAGPDRSRRIEPRDSATARNLGWPEDAGARLAENVDAGFLAVVPVEPVAVGERQRVGWWRIDPESGETIGVMDTGFNQGLTEEEVKKLKIALENFLKKDAEAWRRIRARARLPVPIGQSVARDLAIRDLARELLRDLIRLGY